MVTPVVTLAENGEHEQVAALKAECLRLAEKKHEMECRVVALQRLRGAYRTDAKAAFDFDAYVEEQFQALLAERPARPEQDRQYKELVASTWEITNPGEPLPGADDDEDLVAVGGGGSSLIKNKNCPLTAQPVEELEDPVMDQVGYVYDRRAIKQHIQASRYGREVPAPFAGTMHKITLDSLKDATAEIKLMKRLRRRHQAEEEEEEDGMDLT